MDPGVAEWEILSVDHDEGWLMLIPKSYARGATLGKEELDGKTPLPVNAELRFPGVNRTGTLRY